LSTILILAFCTAWGQEPVPSFAPTGTSPNYPEFSNGTTTEVPSLEAFYLDDLEIEMDGVLDDPAWDLAQTGWGFRQMDPERGAPASVPSVFKVAYDDDAIYFAMACYEDDMANVASFLSRRDQIEASDIVSIYIDPYHDRTTGYNFRVNPAGVMQDDYLFDNGHRDRDWNAVWDAEVSRDENGWYVEIRVPFSQIRFKPSDNMTWGLQAYRWLHGRGEDTGWVMWDRNASGFVSRWGYLTGLRGVENPRKLEVLPYVLTKHVDPAVEGDEDQWQNSQNFGADFKYGVTANLTLNATFQPDFGQVEADPALLNLSPFETFFQEKRPFFIEGARFFQHPDFNLFYSRRIGTGDPNSRIRGAAKLTGKIGGDFSVAVLAAATDIGLDGRAHNPFVAGTQKAGYGLVRLGKEFLEGNHRVNVMGTVVQRDKNSFAQAEDRYQRNGYSGGFDFEMNFRDRMYRVSGSTVGTLVDPFTDHFDPTLSPETKYGTGGELDLRKAGGKLRGVLRGRWESNKLDPNDMGFLRAPDEKLIYGEVSYHYNADGNGSNFNAIDVELESYSSWLYAGNSERHIETTEEAWSYDRSHHQAQGINFFTWAQHKSFNQGWIFIGRSFDGTSKYDTRTFEDDNTVEAVRGPLMTQPGWINIATGGTTDWRKTLSLHLEFHGDWGDNLKGLAGEASLRWNQSEHFSHWIGFGIRHIELDAQWVQNYRSTDSAPDVPGIGGVDYVFGELDQMIWDVTLRSSILFNRDNSLQLYLQPFLTRGNYANAKWLATPDSYDLRHYDTDPSQFDFEYGAVNLNLVYRWEYRPGSTLYLVWTHNKGQYQERGGPENPHWDRDPLWDNGFDSGYPFRTEPGNTFMAKISYWFSI
jgi:hypothetical protein